MVPECPISKNCSFFNDQMIDFGLNIDYRQKYCFGEKSFCARYLVQSKGIELPTDLYPNQHERADHITRKRNLQSRK